MLKKNLALILPILATAAYIPSAYADNIVDGSLTIDNDELISGPITSTTAAIGYGTLAGAIAQVNGTLNAADGTFSGGTSVASDNTFNAILGDKNFAGYNFDFTVNINYDPLTVLGGELQNLTFSGLIPGISLISADVIQNGVTSPFNALNIPGYESLASNNSNAGFLYSAFPSFTTENIGAQNPSIFLTAGWNTFEVKGTIGALQNGFSTGANGITFQGIYSGLLIPNIPPQAVPEPEQWAMLLMGLPLLSWIASRKKAA